MSAWDPFELSAAPLSAYTPGQGDIAMEGKMETATGAPVYHLEDYLAGNAPYVTGATNKKNPSGQVVYRTIGDNVVPVKITDYGPGVKGIDIASNNKKMGNKLSVSRIERYDTAFRSTDKYSGCISNFRWCVCFWNGK